MTFQTTSLLVAALALSACAPGAAHQALAPAPVIIAPPGAAQVADSVRHSVTPADVAFMSGMIGHHAQALIMARWAESHGASPQVRVLAGRIINAQTDEIHLMQNWLRENGLPVPPVEPGMRMVMDGHEHLMLMPGMLSDQQMAQLDSARGRDFDRLFLTFMIQHHRGAVAMVEDLFTHPGAGQNDVVFKFASDANVDQTTEVERMRRMLFDLTVNAGGP
ncbi:MAG TPA: DUF305 domain-containing protein [Gemmatimonadales bacterium]|nr:DUF305 domain-containing protein [Gemmatimonadales bacterium]